MKKQRIIFGIIFLILGLTALVFTFISWGQDDNSIIKVASFYIAILIPFIVILWGLSYFTKESK